MSERHLGWGGGMVRTKTLLYLKGGGGGAAERNPFAPEPNLGRTGGRVVIL